MHFSIIIMSVIGYSEPIEVGYDPVSYVTTETAGFVDLTIRVFSHPGGSPRPFSLAINTQDGSASMSQIVSSVLKLPLLLTHRHSGW